LRNGTLAGVAMGERLIRDVPDGVVAAIDAKAHRTGLSLTEYLWRALVRERVGDTSRVEVRSLKILGREIP